MQSRSLPAHTTRRGRDAVRRWDSRAGHERGETAAALTKAEATSAPRSPTSPHSSHRRQRITATGPRCALPAPLLRFPVTFSTRSLEITRCRSGTSPSMGVILPVPPSRQRRLTRGAIGNVEQHPRLRARWDAAGEGAGYAVSPGGGRSARAEGICLWAGRGPLRRQCLQGRLAGAALRRATRTRR